MSINETEPSINAFTPLLNEPIVSSNSDNPDNGNEPSNSNANANDNDIDLDSMAMQIQPFEETVKNKLGTLNGVYVPCLLNIMGVILFERLGWGVGNIGTSGILAFFSIAELQAILTVLSLSAIVTNGNMRGGGSYYMISRTLGPEFGGSVGLLFYVAYCVGVAFYCTGFAEEVVETWFESSSISAHWLKVAWGSCVLFVALLVAMGGARYFTKINVFLFFWQFFAQFIAALACFLRETFVIENSASTACYDQGNLNPNKYYHQSWSISNFKDSWSVGSCSSCSSFAATFAVVFPAATGIMEGANLSGDLANPTYSIPVGTLSAVVTSICCYMMLVISFGGSFSLCVLREDTTIMQETAWGNIGTYLVVCGILISASSSALGSLFGGSRVLQAIARDELFPYLDIFKYGTRKGDEPRVAVLLTWIIAQALTFVGSINTIAPISTSFFCLSYATVNFSCFLLEISGTPNFRPSFTYYTWYTCLIGTFLNLFVMFYVDYVFGSIALSLEILVFVYLAYRAPKNVWGDVTQSVIFHQVRKYLLRLDERKMHSKLWRPSILLLADTEDLALVDFCNTLKKGGLYIIGTTILGDFGDHVELTHQVHRQWVEFIDQNSIKAFPQVAVAPTARNGFENLLLLSGLGAMQPNTVVVPLLRLEKKIKTIAENVAQSPISSTIGMSARQPSVLASLPDNLTSLVQSTPATMQILEYTRLVSNILEYKRNMVITANFEKLDFELLVSANIRDQREQQAQQEQEQEQEQELKESKENKEESDGVVADGNSDIASRFTGLQPYWSKHSNSGIGKQKSNQWVDVWLFASDYTFDLNDQQDRGFPMLMMQLAHILLQNRIWTKAAGLRVFLFTPINAWTSADQDNFDDMVRELRLGVDQLVVLKEPRTSKPTWPQIVNNQKTRRQVLRYFQRLNKTMLSLSQQTSFTFIKLPALPPNNKQIQVIKDQVNNDIQEENMDGSVDDNVADRSSGNELQYSQLYFDSLYTLLKGMPPTALVATGEELPVISMDI